MIGLICLFVFLIMMRPNDNNESSGMQQKMIMAKDERPKYPKSCAQIKVTFKDLRINMKCIKFSNFKAFIIILYF